MLQGVDINQVKQYNASLKQYRDQAARLKAEIEYTNKELDSLCDELSKDLGIQVTRDNVEQIYKEQVEKINSTLNSGNAVLAKIAEEKQKVTMEPQAQQAQTQQQQVAPIQNQAPIQQIPFNNNNADMTPPTPPTMGSVFDGQPSTLTPIFNLG